LVAALFIPRLRLPLLAASTVPAVLDWLDSRGPNTAAQYVALRLADDVAYGAGAWLGAVEQRNFGALAPRFTSWPGRTPG
jgi:hypothetical protein